MSLVDEGPTMTIGPGAIVDKAMSAQREIGRQEGRAEILERVRKLRAWFDAQVPRSRPSSYYEGMDDGIAVCERRCAEILGEMWADAHAETT